MIRFLLCAALHSPDVRLTKRKWLFSLLTFSRTSWIEKNRTINHTWKSNQTYNTFSHKGMHNFVLHLINCMAFLVKYATKLFSQLHHKQIRTLWRWRSVRPQRAGLRLARKLLVLLLLPYSRDLLPLPDPRLLVAAQNSHIQWKHNKYSTTIFWKFVRCYGPSYLNNLIIKIR